MEIKYLEHSLDKILTQYLKKQPIPPGKTLYTYEHFIDPIKKSVVFKLYLKDQNNELSVHTV